MNFSVGVIASAILTLTSYGGECMPGPGGCYLGGKRPEKLPIGVLVEEKPVAQFNLEYHCDENGYKVCPSNKTCP